MKEINSNKETLKRNLLDLIELQHILQGTQVFFQEVSITCSVCVCVCGLGGGGGGGVKEVSITCSVGGLGLGGGVFDLSTFT